MTEQETYTYFYSIEQEEAQNTLGPHHNITREILCEDGIFRPYTVMVQGKHKTLENYPDATVIHFGHQDDKKKLNGILQ